MITAFGYLTLALAFLLAAYGFIMVIWGLLRNAKAFIESARLALILIFPLLTMSLLVMIILLLDNRFDVAYVYSVSSQEMPAYLKLTAIWGGQSGSLLFWSWLLAGFSMVFSTRNWQQDRDLLPWVLLVMLLILGFFLALNVFMEIPFERFWRYPDGRIVTTTFQPQSALQVTPQDGQGLNPLLRHPGMIWHPPTLYLGFIGFVIPFSVAIASLAVGRKDHRWIEISRVWVLIAWVFLSLGLVLGMRWAYDVLGWGGYWGWDPVEIAGLMPWLSATAYMHTAMMQKKKNSYHRFSYVLMVLTFSLVIFGTFLTRSGVLSSVHSFAGSNIGPSMFVFTTIILLGGAGLLVYRWHDFQNKRYPEFKFSREVLTLFSNMVLLSILAVCFLGVIYPVISELLTGTQVTVGPAWYERINGPLLALLLFLMGICPLAIWSGKNLKQIGRQLIIYGPISVLIPLLTFFMGGIENLFVLGALWLAAFSGLMIIADYIKHVQHQRHGSQNIFQALWRPFGRNHRRYGGLLIHLGIVVMSVGIIGLEGMQQETQKTLSIGESASVGQYKFRFEGIENYEMEDGRNITEALIAVSRDGESFGALYPQREIYTRMGLAVTNPGLISKLFVDLYVILVDWRPIGQESATFRFFVNPLVNGLWFGTSLLTLGTIIAILPVSRRRRVSG